jgi:cell division protein ZapA
MSVEKPISVTLLDKDYLVSCKENERESLYAAVKFLNQKMLDLREGGKIIGVERIAVMAALNIAHELLEYKRQDDQHASKVDAGIRRMQNKIKEALIKNRQLEL